MMINVTGKLQNLSFEYVGTNETPKLTIELNCNGAVIPVPFIGNAALNALALTGIPGDANGCLPNGVILSVYATPGFRYWEGNETQAAKTFNTELTGVNLLVLGTLGADASRFYFQGLLHDFQTQTGEGQNGPWTRHSVKLAVSYHTKNEGALPGAVFELTVPEAMLADVQNALGQFTVVSGTVGSYAWIAKSGKNVGQQQRALRYTVGSVAALGNPAWVTAHPSFAVPAPVATPAVAAPAAVAPANTAFAPAAPLAPVAPMAQAAGAETPLF